jgi:hypothetical protein
VAGRQGRRRRKLLDNLKEWRWYSHLKEEDLDRTMWRARFGRGFGPVVRQTAKWINEWMTEAWKVIIAERNITCKLLFQISLLQKWKISRRQRNSP